MTMTPQQVFLVRSSFELVQPISRQAATLFYDNLFKADPTLRQLFTGDMAHQGERLMAMIGNAVGMLERPGSLMPMLQLMGIRHACYGVQDRHYATVGQALLLALEQGLGDAFTREVRDAWAALYSMISRTMIDAARMPEAAR